MSILKDALMQGTRGAQPAAATVGEGTLYFVTDEEVTEQQLAGAWEPYSPTVAGTGTVTNTGTLTDHAIIVGNGGVDVSALGSLGSTTTVLHGAAAGDPTWGAVVEADITLADNTTNDVTSTKHGLAPKAPADVTKFLNGSATAAWSVPNLATILLNSQGFTYLNLRLVNVAGTLQHAMILYNGSTTLPAYVSKITGASATLANTPTVGAGVDFTSGGGLTGNRFVFNTAAQTDADFFAIAVVNYYNGNVNLPRTLPVFTSRDVNGTTRLRLELGFTISQSGATWNINTTNIPSGTEINVSVFAFLA